MSQRIETAQDVFGAIAEDTVIGRTTRLAFAVSAATVMALSVANPAEARGKGRNGAACRANVEGWLREGGVDLATVESIDIRARTRRNNDGDRVFQGWEGWVRFNNQDGAVVFTMQRHCQLQHSWTTGDVQWDGPGATC